MVNLADLYRGQQRDEEGQQWLEKAIAVEPNAAEPIYALGLLKVRQKKLSGRAQPAGKSRQPAAQQHAIQLRLCGGTQFHRTRGRGDQPYCSKLTSGVPRTARCWRL